MAYIFTDIPFLFLLFRFSSQIYFLLSFRSVFQSVRTWQSWGIPPLHQKWTHSLRHRHHGAEDQGICLSLGRFTFFVDLELMGVNLRHDNI